jgi:hypothetical protein
VAKQLLRYIFGARKVVFAPPLYVCAKKIDQRQLVTLGLREHAELRSTRAAQDEEIAGRPPAGCP